MLCYCSGTLADYFLLENLCKGLVASLCNHTWLGSKFFGTFTRIVEKVYNLCRVKANRLAVLTVKSGLDPHMIIELEDDLNLGFIYVVDDDYL